MLVVSNLTYRIAGRTILEDAQLTIMDGWKVGVVGANGAGKSTLFKLINNDLQADLGDITRPAKNKYAMVRQDLQECDTPLIEMVLEADEERARLMLQGETETDPYKIAEIHTRLNDIGAYVAPARAATILSGLGFSEAQQQEPFSAFSGGWRMRVALAAVLFLQPEFLLLDEPTNHLDLEAIMWLEGYLANYPHSLMIISHDRSLLNKCVDHVVHVDEQKLTLYTGNYDQFEKERAEKRGLQQKMHEKQQVQRAHLQSYIDRFRYKASKAKQAQSRIKALERMDVVGAVIADRAIKFNFPSPEKLAPPIISIDHADVGYVEGLPVLKDVHERIDMDDRIALLGANGNGKSTLIKLIADKLQAMTGEVRRTSKLRIGYFSQHQTEELDVNSTPYDEMACLMPDAGEAAVRKKLGQFNFSKALADNKITKLSGGEKARLLFALMSYDAPHLLLLDEPTNHLDMEARSALVDALNNYEGAVIIVSHDPSMVEMVADRLWMVHDGRCIPFEGDLQEYRKFVLDLRRQKKQGEKKNKDKNRIVNKKQRRKAEAERRKKYVHLYRDVEKAEKKLAVLIKDKKQIEQTMADPVFYDDADLAKKVQFDYSALLKKIEKAEALWFESQEIYDSAGREDL